MNLSDQERRDYRTKVRTWLRAHVPQPVADQTGDEYLAMARKFQSELYEAGYAGITLPRAYGGWGLGSAEQQIFDEEAEEFSLPVEPFAVGMGMCAPTLADLGTEAQKSRYLPQLLRGTEIWCQMFSEPGAGSDLASLQTRAVADQGGWVISGQKVWTTNAQWADFGALLARTDPDKPKHEGITMFIADMRMPGVTVRPLKDMTGVAHFNEIFLDEVRVPADSVIGQVNDGWRAAATMLGHERVYGGGSWGPTNDPLEFNSLVELGCAHKVIDEPGQRERLAELYMHERVLKLFNARMQQEAAAGSPPGARGSVAKLAIAVLRRRAIDVASELVGAAAIAWDSDDSRGEELAEGINSAPSYSIAGGTDEVQHNIIGERLLGLPKEPQVDRGIPFKELKVGTQRR